MEFTKEQLSELICKHTEKENGLHDLMELPGTSATGTVPVVPMVMSGQ